MSTFCTILPTPNSGRVISWPAITDSTARRLKEYPPTRDLTVTLISGYRADQHYKAVKRLEEPAGERC